MAPDPPRPPATLDTPPPEGRNAPSKWLIVIAVVLGICFLLGILLLTLGYYSMRRFSQRGREGEGKYMASQLARGIIHCTDGASEGVGSALLGGGLPPSTGPVPSLLADVSGKAYTSTKADWSHPTFVCAKFETTAPQHFQVEWELRSPTTGISRVRADFDGDGKVDTTYEIDVECSAWPDLADLKCRVPGGVREH